MEGGYGLCSLRRGILCIQVDVIFHALRRPEPHNAPGSELLLIDQHFQHVLGIVIDFFGLFAYLENMVRIHLKMPMRASKKALLFKATPPPQPSSPTLPFPPKYFTAACPWLGLAVRVDYSAPNCLS